jgi:hypothetical protein
MTDISETSVFDSIDDAKASITHLATLQKRPVVISILWKLRTTTCTDDISPFGSELPRILDHSRLATETIREHSLLDFRRSRDARTIQKSHSTSKKIK